MIRYKINLPDALHARARFGLRLLFEAQGIVSAPAAGDEDPDLVYGGREGEEPAQALHVPHFDGNWDDPERSLPTDPSDVNDADPVSLTWFFAAGIAESVQNRSDFGLPIARGSRLWREGALQRPYVAELSGSLLRLVRRHAEARNRSVPVIPRWPDGRTFAIVVTHDVDRPFSRPPASHYRARIARDWRRGTYRDATRGALAFVKNVVIAGDSGRDPHNDPQFGFDRWMRVEEDLGIRSAFYFAVRGSADAVGNVHDVYYDARHPAIVGAMRDAIARGFEVGLHASIASRDDPSLLADERKQLSTLLDGLDVRGVRHHYLALSPSLPERTLGEHASVGFRYDSSLGFSDAAAFRRGVAWPFRPFDKEHGSEINVLQIPLTAMDIGLFHHARLESEPIAALEAHVDTVEKAGGCAVLNWHVANAAPERLHGAGPALIEVLRRRIERHGNSVWLTTPGRLEAWWTERRSRVFP